MEVTLQELIDSIKKDGVETAERRSEEIISAAEDKADAIIRKAQQQADKTIEKAQKEAAMREQSSISSVEQACRDLIIALKKSITQIFDELLENRIAEGLSVEKTVSSLLKSVLKADMLDGDNGSIDVDEKNLADMQKIVMNDLSEKMKKGLDIKPVKNLGTGFRIAESDGSGYFSVTSEVLAEMIGKYLNPELNNMIQEAAKKGA